MEQNKEGFSEGMRTRFMDRNNNNRGNCCDLAVVAAKGAMKMTRVRRKSSLS
jgi:hypothetical protein